MHTKRFFVGAAVALCLMVAVGAPSAWAQKSYTWVGADGGSWAVSANWDDGSHIPSGAPAANDFAQFTAFSGTVAGALAANTLYVGPGSDLTLDGSGFLSQTTVGQDLDGNTGAASLTVAAGQIVSTTLLDLGSALGGSGTLTAQGTFSSSAGIVTDQTGVADTIVAAAGGSILDGTSLTMAAGGSLRVDPSGTVVIGDAAGVGTAGALTILKGFFFYGEGTITGNVIVNGLLETYNAGWPVNTLTVNGNVSGSGSVSVVQELDVNGTISPGVTLSLFANGGSNKGLLRLAEPTQDKGALGTLSTGSIIALTGLSFDQVSWSAANGLTLSGASGTLELATTGDHSFQSFTLQPDAISGTDIIVGVGSGVVPVPASSTLMLSALASMILLFIVRPRRDAAGSSSAAAH